MKVRRIVNSVFNSNTYIVEDKRNAWLIDCGDYEPIKKYFIDSGIRLQGVFLTHVHYDHFYGLPKLLCDFPECPVFTSEFGKVSLASERINLSKYHSDPIILDIPNIQIIGAGERMASSLNILVLATPGHDKSSLSYIVEDWLFTGDSYIPGEKVIDRFPNSNKEQARYIYSLLRDIASLYNLCPGHGDIVPKHNL